MLYYTKFIQKNFLVVKYLFFWLRFSSIYFTVGRPVTLFVSRSDQITEVNIEKSEEVRQLGGGRGGVQYIWLW